MVVTNDATIHSRLAHYKGQGLAKYREYWHDVVGFNYRMTNICAAIGVAQLEQIETFLAKKLQIAKWYEQGISGLPLQFHKSVGDVYHSYWMCSILVEKASRRDGLRDFLKENSIETRPTFYPIHTMPPYAKKYERHAVAENIASRGMNLPSYPALEKEDVEFICAKIREYYEKR
jgi:perosamine synthetase